MDNYTIQFNDKRDADAAADTYTVFDAWDKWVGVFRDRATAVKFVKTVLNGTITYDDE